MGFLGFPSKADKIAKDRRQKMHDWAFEAKGYAPEIAAQSRPVFGMSDTMGQQSGWMGEQAKGLANLSLSDPRVREMQDRYFQNTMDQVLPGLNQDFSQMSQNAASGAGRRFGESSGGGLAAAQQANAMRDYAIQKKMARAQAMQGGMEFGMGNVRQNIMGGVGAMGESNSAMARAVAARMAGVGGLSQAANTILGAGNLMGGAAGQEQAYANQQSNLINDMVSSLLATGGGAAMKMFGGGGKAA